jgi:Ca-activated chloride channel homolog
MIRFAHPEYLRLLFLLPVFAAAVWFVWRVKRGKMRAYGMLSSVFRLVDERSRVKYWLRSSILMLALASLMLAAANPQIGTKFEEVTRSGVDLIVAMDVSASMLAQDIKPNRITAAKRELSELIDQLKGDRIGLIIFAGDAYTQLPLTTDYGAAAMLSDIVTVGSAPRPGTAIGAAIQRATESFAKDEGKYKALIIITDGENHEDDAVGAAKEAAAKGVVIHTIGMGSPDGAPIPYGEGGEVSGFKTDQEGKTIMTRLDEKTLQDVASTANGVYIRASNTRNDLVAVFREIEKMEKKEFGSKQFTSYEDRFQYLVALAAALLIAELFLSEKRNRFLSRFAIFAPKES